MQSGERSLAAMSLVGLLSACGGDDGARGSAGATASGSTSVGAVRPFWANILAWLSPQDFCIQPQ